MCANVGYNYAVLSRRNEESTMPRNRLYLSISTGRAGVPVDSARPDSAGMPDNLRGEDDAVRPARRRLTGLLDIFAAFPDDFMRAGRGKQEQKER
jgi:antitoxin VapB